MSLLLLLLLPPFHYPILQSHAQAAVLCECVWLNYDTVTIEACLV